jgi:hypothetical protein
MSIMHDGYPYIGEIVCPDKSRLIQRFAPVQCLSKHSDTMLKPKAERNDSAVEDHLEKTREVSTMVLVQLLFLSRNPRYFSSVVSIYNPPKSF